MIERAQGFNTAGGGASAVSALGERMQVVSRDASFWPRSLGLEDVEPGDASSAIAPRVSSVLHAMRGVGPAQRDLAANEGCCSAAPILQAAKTTFSRDHGRMLEF